MINKKCQHFIFSALFGLGLSSCSTLYGENRCENIETINAQKRQCEILKKQLLATTNPQAHQTLQQRYESECTEFRYYRDDYETVCKNRKEDG